MQSATLSETISATQHANLREASLHGTQMSDALETLEKQFPGAAIGLLESFGPRLPELSSRFFPFLRTLDKYMHEQDAGDRLRLIFSKLPVKLIETHGSELLDLIFNIPGDEFNLTPFGDPAILNAFVKDPTFFIQLARNTGSGFDKTAVRLPDKLSAIQKEIILKLSEFAGIDMDDVIIHINKCEAFFEKPERLLEFVNYWKGASPAIINKFRYKDLFAEASANEAILKRLHRITGTGFERLITSVECKDWESVALPLAIRYREGAAEIYKTRLHHLHRYDQEFLRLCEENRRNFGVVNIARYVFDRKDNIDLYFLKENLRNLDPEYRKDKKLAVVISTRADHNGALAQDMFAHLEKLEKDHKVFIVEVSARLDAKLAVKYIADLHKGNTQELSGKGVSAVYLMAHSNSNKVRLHSHKLKNNKHYLDKNDNEALDFWDGMNKENAKIIVVACSVSRGGKRADNFLSRLKRNNSFAKVYGARKNITRAVTMIAHGEIQDIQFTSDNFPVAAVKHW